MRYSLILLSILIVYSSYAEMKLLPTIAKEGARYVVEDVDNITITKTHSNGQTDTVFANNDDKFQIIIIDDDLCIVEFYNIQNSGGQDSVRKNTRYVIQASQLTEGACTFSSGFVISTITNPIKVRLGNGSWDHRWEMGVNIAGAVGYSFKFLCFKRFTPYIFAGYTSINNGAIKEDNGNVESDLDLSHGAAVGAGLLASITTDINIGISIGWDFIIGTQPDGWQWQGTPWLSFGIGIPIKDF